MLQIIRDKAQGWVAWILIFAIGIAFTFLGTGWFFNHNENENIAKVNGESISLQKFAQRVDQVRVQNQSAAEMDASQLKAMLLENMINEIALMQASEKRGFRVSSNQVNQLLQGIHIFQEDGKFSFEKLNQLLRELQLTPAEFHQQLQEMMMISQIEEGVRDSSFSLPSDLANHIKYLNQKRHIKYAQIEPQRFQADLSIPEDDLKNYYDKHHANFKTDETLQVEYIALVLQDLMAKIDVKDEEAKEFYESHKALFETPKKIKVAHILVTTKGSKLPADIENAKAKIADIQARLQKGENFEALARANSEDPVSAQQGGALEWIAKGEVVPAFEKPAFDLKQKGDVSDVIETPFGFHIIKLLDQQDSSLKQFDEVKAEVITEIKRQKAEEQQVNMADEMVTLAYEHPESLQAIADKLNLEIKTSDTLTRNGGKGIFAAPEVLKAAFSQEVVELQQNSDLVKIEPETYVVMHSKVHQASELKPFADVRTEVEAEVRTLKLNERLKAFSETVMTALNQSDNLDKIASEHQLTWQDKTVTRAEVSFDRDILTKAFAVSRPQEGRFEVGITPTSTGYAIVLVDKVEDGEISQLPSDRLDFIQGFLANSLGQVDYDLYVSEIIKEAKVERFLKKQVEDAE